MMGALDTTFLIAKVTEQMDEKGVELTDIKINDDSVTFNNSVNISLYYCLPHNIMKIKDLETAIEYKYNIVCKSSDVVSRIIDILTSQQEEWLPGDKIEAYGEWFTLVIEEDNHYTVSNNEYCSYRLLDNDCKLSKQMTLEDLKMGHTNVSLEKRLK